jgi:hypothetical protein
MSLHGAPSAAQPVSGVRTNSSTALKNLLDTRAHTVSSNSSRKGVRKSNLSRVNEVAQYMSCESSTIRVGASGNCGKAEQSALSRCKSNCVVHVGRSEHSVCKSSGGRSAGGRLRNRYVLREEVMHALTPSVDVFLHVPRPDIRRVQSPLFTFHACQRNVECLEAARKKCESELALGKYTHPPQKADSAEEAWELAWGTECGEWLT